MNLVRTIKWLAATIVACGAVLTGTAQSVALSTATTNYLPAGGTVAFTVSVDYTVGSLSAMGYEFVLPDGWSYTSTSGEFKPDVRPSAGTTGTIGYAYTDLSEFPASTTFTMTLTYGAGLSGDQSIGGTLLYTPVDGTASNKPIAAITFAAQPTAPAISGQPVSLTVNEGSPAHFSAAATGSPTPTYQWFKGDTAITGATNSSYDIASVTAADVGSYKVVATNSQGSATSNVVTLAVNVGPAITTQPQSATVNQGDNVTFSVVATGTEPLTYQWKKGSTDIPNATGASLTLTGVLPGDEASYSVTVTNSVSFVTSSAATLTVVVPPSITTAPSSQTVAEGTPFSFSVVVSGTAPFTYQWKRDGQAITGATSATYGSSTAARADTGSYSVTATNAAGGATSAAATLDVQFKPVITTQPTAQTSGVGGTVSFSVVAEANPTATYQWRKGGSDITGATGATLMLSNVQLVDDQASYDVVVTNSVGSTTSSAVKLTVNEGPAVTTPPSSVTVSAGGSATFTVVASGNPAPTYQWQKNGSNITGATSASLTINPVAVADAGSYAVVLTNTVGSVTSPAAALDVQYKPVITTQPASKTANVGGSADFMVVAEANPTATYQWRRGGQDINGATGATLTVTGLVIGDNGASFDVVVTNTVGSTTSSAATLTVTEAPAFTTQPQAATVAEGGAVTFTAAASGNPTPTYQWMKDGSPITGATSATLNLTSIARTAAGSYTVVATNSIGSTTSSAAALDVQFKPEITVQPKSQTVAVGGSVTFSVDGDGNPNPTLQWYRDGQPVTGATKGELTLTGLTVQDNGSTFYLVGTNSIGSVQSDTVTLTVTEAPAFSTQPQSVTVTEGGTASFTAAASGNPTPTYQWMKDGAPVSGATSATLSLTNVKRTSSGSYTVVATNASGSATSSAATLDVQFAPEVTKGPVSQTIGVGGSVTFTVDGTSNPDATLQWYRNGEAITGATSDTLTLSNLKLSDSGSTFYLIGTNTIGTAQTDTATLTVQEIPAITTQPVGGTVNAGQGFTFTVVVTGTPTPTLQWRKGGTAISGATSATLALTNLQPGDAGSYDVVVTNPQATVTSSAAVLVVRTLPEITTQPVGGKKVVGQSFTFTVTASGTAPLTYQWNKDGTAISGATGSSLTLDPLAIENGGVYTVTVTNVVGSTTSSGAELIVDRELKAPTITTQPQNVSVKTGSTATFMVAATGNPTPTYQWRKNGAAISGATSTTLTLTNAQAAAAGSYDVVVTNSQGSVTSSLARLTVTTADVAPVITSQPRDYTVGRTVPVTFTVVATGVPAPTFQWRKNGGAITGATSASYTIASPEVADGGTYSVVVTNTAGSVTSRNATLKVLARSYAGTYFGSFGPGRGSFAIVIGPDNTGHFLGFDEQAGLYVSGDVTVKDDGSFVLTVTNQSPTGGSSSGGLHALELTANAESQVTFTAQISDNGSVTGTVTGVSGLSMNAEKEVGAVTESVAGFYEANAGGSDAVTLTIVAPSGKVLLLTKSSTGADAGVGTASEAGAIAVTTVKNNTVTATVSTTAATISAEVTDSTGAKTSFTGGSSEVIATQRLVNISSRANAGTGDSQTFAGFVISGQDSKTVLIRAVGPGLTPFGVPNVLPAPTLNLYNSNKDLLATNTGWNTSADATEIAAAANLAGAFALDTANADSAILATLAPGAYSTIAGNAAGGTGVVLIEVYDLSNPAPGQKLFNISTRAAVGVGDNVTVAGFVVSGSVPKRVLLRGAGPALAAFGLNGVLADPKITLYKGKTEIATNDDWGTNAAAVTAASTSTGAFQFTTGSKDAAIVISLEPGAYSMHLSGVGGTTGIGLIEVYEVP